MNSSILWKIVNGRLCKNKALGKLQLKCGEVSVMPGGIIGFVSCLMWAVRCYQKCGFEIVGEPYQLELSSGAEIFYRMERE